LGWDQAKEEGDTKGPRRKEVRSFHPVSRLGWGGTVKKYRAATGKNKTKTYLWQSSGVPTERHSERKGGVKKISAAMLQRDCGRERRGTKKGKGRTTEEVIVRIG